MFITGKENTNVQVQVSQHRMMGKGYSKNEHPLQKIKMKLVKKSLNLLMGKYSLFFFFLNNNTTADEGF